MQRFRTMAAVGPTLATLLVASVPLVRAMTTEDPADVWERTIMAGDRIRVTVEEDEGLSQVYPVAGDGTIDFGYIGRVPVENMTVVEAADILTERLEDKYFIKANVQVDIAEFVEGDVFVLGEVNEPKIIPFSSDHILTLVEAISMCDGFTRSAQGSAVRILRWKPGGSMERQSIVIDVQDMFDTMDFRNDQYLRPRDMIVVPRMGEGDGASEFLALGEVGNGGFHPHSQGMDLVRALSRFGGPARDGQPESASVLRPDGQGGYTSIPVDIARLLGAADMTQNIPILAGDIIYVPSKEHASKGRVYLLGEVERPGAFDLPSDRDATVAKTLLQAGGFTEYGNGGKVRIIREGPEGKKQELVVDVDRILKRGTFEDDIPLRDGDVVIVPARVLF